MITAASFTEARREAMPARTLLALAVLLACAAAVGCSSSTAHRPAAAASSTAPERPVSTAPATSSARRVASRHAAEPREPVRRTSVPMPVPPVSAAAHAAGLVDIRTVVSDAIVDLRYATTDNFTHVRLYPRGARCLVHESMTHGLRTAARVLRREGYLLVFWDCYRPHSVQQRMWDVVPNPAWVARPGPYARSHEAGRSVDVTLARASGAGCATTRVAGHCLLDMGTGFDDFTPRAYAYATGGVSPQAQRDRATLRAAMSAGGITVYGGEWWHFDGPGAGVDRPHLHAPPY